MSEPKLRIISLGAGVQSSTMALMAAHGEFEHVPDCAIFADTRNEPDSVYDWLSKLEPVLPFPVHHVEKGNLADDLIDYRDGKSRTGANIPFFVLKPDNSVGPVNRSCTRDYKIKPIQKKAKELLGFKSGQRIPAGVHVEQWIGISLDEAHRMKESQLDWVKNRYPLIDKRLARGDCLIWMERHGYPRPPRSACWHCPYSSDERWKHLKSNEAGDFAKAVAFDAELRNPPKWRGSKGQAFLHRSCVPLDEADFGDEQTIDMFGNECEGVCGV